MEIKTKLDEAISTTATETQVTNPETTTEDDQIVNDVSKDIKSSLPTEEDENVNADDVTTEEGVDVITEDSFGDSEGGVDAIPLTQDVINKLVLGDVALKLIGSALREDNGLIDAVIRKKEDRMIIDIHAAEKMKKKIITSGQSIMKQFDSWNEEYKKTGERLFKRIG